MSSKSIGLSSVLHAYVLAHGLREAPALVRLREATAGMAMAGMQISPEQGALMALLVELLEVRRYLEVGVFTGYSSLAVALAMAEGGEVTALDRDGETAAVARRHWDAAGVGNRIDLRLGEAAESLDALLAEGRAASYDMAFIDAEKTAYDLYYERALALVRPGGLVALDNMFQSGRVAEPEPASEASRVVDALNAKIHDDARVSMALLPVGDGLMLCRRRL